MNQTTIYVLFEHDGWDNYLRSIGAFSSLEGAQSFIPNSNWKLLYPNPETYKGYQESRNLQIQKRILQE